VFISSHRKKEHQMFISHLARRTAGSASRLATATPRHVHRRRPVVPSSSSSFFSVRVNPVTRQKKSITTTKATTSIRLASSQSGNHSVGDDNELTLNSTASSVDRSIEFVDPSLCPEGYPTQIMKELKHLNNSTVSSWVVRNLTREICQRLEAHVAPHTFEQDGTQREEEGGEALKDGVVVLAGPKEHGKSVILCQVVQWARRNGWIVLYSPNSGNLLRKGVQIYPSRHFEGYYDQPDLAGPLLMSMRKAHAKELNSLQVKGTPRPTYVAERARKDKAKAERTGKAVPNREGYCTLLDVCDHGLLNGADAATSYRDLREQLSIVDDESMKILYVVDDLNATYNESIFGYDMKMVEGSELTLSSSVQPFDAKGLRSNFVPKRGAVVAATTGTFQYLPKEEDVKKAASDLYHYTVPVRPYDAVEFDAAMRMFSHSGLVPKNVLRPVGQPEKRSELILSDIASAKVATSSHPGILYEHIVAYSIGQGN